MSQEISDDIPPPFKQSERSGRRLVHLIPDELAQSVPDHVLFSYPKPSEPKDEFVDISARCFSRAINQIAWWMKESLGPPQDFDTVAYVGPSMLLPCSTRAALFLWLF